MFLVLFLKTIPQWERLFQPASANPLCTAQVKLPRITTPLEEHEAKATDIAAPKTCLTLSW